MEEFQWSPSTQIKKNTKEVCEMDRHRMLSYCSKHDVSQVPPRIRKSELLPPSLSLGRKRIRIPEVEHTSREDEALGEEQKIKTLLQGHQENRF
ncbi:hypothetical protein TGGT1_285825 [Toxoplasma gondii GT1]|uniref:Uncharacterized protein n=9 Tax=Toxoplasma gondii TaxID=5811 RepID=S7UN05_TOXGG|nr:hypothetical protein TGGT1_285825 [Toxoplasma gondii GT1]KAF4643863.1 hypothetical protein TGRH88_026190 [Toxoplasma gondii]KFG54736.1 hypothetical protein TGFOU_285825 [Toxoplasma gondii FOU]KFH08344.1 hypothetical protein TGVAND_285825 [Toxoplasma gondii VAND]PUA88008.1 hypothetical protein TGBR9_285825 [Toxoplasma gondii TgCATBr9]RQX69812.1 hypothetical protein TGCAST_285825 [Toxoplasma gondii CAST]